MEQVALVGLLALSWWLATLGAVFVSGAIPLRAGPRRPRAGTGALAVTGLGITATLLAVVSVSSALDHSGWPYAVVGAGLGSVLAPPCFPWLPRRLRDQPLGAVALTAGCAAAVGAWLTLGEGWQ